MCRRKMKNEKTIVVLKAGAKQLLQLSGEASQNPKALRWLADKFRRLPEGLDDLAYEKLVFMKDLSLWPVSACCQHLSELERP